VKKVGLISTLILTGVVVSCAENVVETATSEESDINKFAAKPLEESTLSKEESEKRLTKTLDALTNKSLSLSEDCQNLDKRVKFKDSVAKVGVVQCNLNHLEVYLASGEVEYRVDSCKHGNEDIEFSYFVFKTKSNNNLEMISDGEVKTPIFICSNN